jgi:hypothetical protein
MTIRHRAISLPLIALLIGAPAMTAAGPLRASVACQSPRDGDGDGPRTIHVRVFNQSRLTLAEIQRLLEVADDIWRPYGITIEPGSNEEAVSVVLAARPTRAAAGNNAAVLGTTLFAKGHATPYINLSLSAAEAAADDSNEGGVSFTARPREQRDAMLLRMLGVALAHEMAHYLLDTSEHSRAGLLREGLRVSELTHPVSAHLALSPEQLHHLCQVREAPRRP